MSELIKEKGFDKPDLSTWMSTIKGWKKEHPFKYAKGEHITSQEAVDILYQESKGEGYYYNRGRTASNVGSSILQI